MAGSRGRGYGNRAPRGERSLVPEEPPALWHVDAVQPVLGQVSVTPLGEFALDAPEPDTPEDSAAATPPHSARAVQAVTNRTESVRFTVLLMATSGWHFEYSRGRISAGVSARERQGSASLQRFGKGAGKGTGVRCVCDSPTGVSGAKGGGRATVCRTRRRSMRGGGMRSTRWFNAVMLAVVLVVGSVGQAFAWSVGSNYVTIPCTTGCGQQAYNNWCGVASTHAVLHKLGHNVSQSTLASKLGVGKADGSATAIEDIPGVLGDYIKNFTYVRVKRTDIDSASLMTSIAQYCADNGHLGIPCVNPYPYTNSNGQYSPGLPTYSGTAKGGHYIVIRGYNNTSSTQTIYFWDPHYDPDHYGYHSASASTFWKCMYYKNWGSQGVVY